MEKIITNQMIHQLNLQKIMATKSLYDLNRFMSIVRNILIKSIFGEIILDLQEIEIWIKVFTYLSQDEALSKHYNIYPTKGLLILGSVGVGKTTLTKVIQHFLYEKEGFIIKSCRSIAHYTSIKGPEFLSNLYFEPQHICFDDLGAERKIKYYGSAFNVMSEIIQFRYDLYQSQKILSSFTSNLDAKQIEENYGLRVRSRLREMCNVIIFPRELQDKRR